MALRNKQILTRILSADLEKVRLFVLLILQFNITCWLIVLGGALLAGIFLFVYTFIDSTPHGMYGDDQAKKVHRLLILLELQMAEACFLWS